MGSVELFFFVAAVAATDERGDGHLLPAGRGPAARAADLLVRALRQGVHFQTEKPETRAQRALRLQPRTVPLLQQGTQGQLQPEAARVPGAQHEGESYSYYRHLSVVTPLAAVRSVREEGARGSRRRGIRPVVFR